MYSQNPSRKASLSATIALLAVQFRIGAYALTGSLVRYGEPLRKGADVDIVVTAPLQSLTAFAQETAAQMDRNVHLYSFEHLHWMHRYHVEMQWKCVTRLPVIPAPVGGLVRHNGMDVRVEQIAHFLPVKTRIETKRGPQDTIIACPPPGVFLI